MTNNFKVGNYLIDSNQVYSIYKITEGRLFYRPAQKGGNHPSVTGSIPANNAIAAGFRPLLSPEEIKKFFKALAVAVPINVEIIDTKLYKEMLITNDPFKIIPLLKQLWKSKHQPNVNFSGTSRDTLEDIIDHLALEFSISTKKPYDLTRKKILTALSK